MIDLKVKEREKRNNEKWNWNLQQICCVVAIRWIVFSWYRVCLLDIVLMKFQHEWHPYKQNHHHLSLRLLYPYSITTSSTVVHQSSCMILIRWLCVFYIYCNVFFCVIIWLDLIKHHWPLWSLLQNLHRLCLDCCEIHCNPLFKLNFLSRATVVLKKETSLKWMLHCSPE